MDGDVMYSGKMTAELVRLYADYNEKFGVEPDYYEVLDYGDEDYDDYIKDIKTAIATNTHLPDLYPDDEDDF